MFLILGGSCKISILLRNLSFSSPTGVFEWFSSIFFKDIIYLLEKKFENISFHNIRTRDHVNIYNEKINITEDKEEDKKGMLHIRDTNICSKHYTIWDYPEIFKRR